MKTSIAMVSALVLGGIAFALQGCAGGSGPLPGDRGATEQGQGGEGAGQGQGEGNGNGNGNSSSTRDSGVTTSPSNECTPNSFATCDCPTGSAGIRQCASDGESYGPCQCG